MFTAGTWAWTEQATTRVMCTNVVLIHGICAGVMVRNKLREINIQMNYNSTPSRNVKSPVRSKAICHNGACVRVCASPKLCTTDKQSYFYLCRVLRSYRYTVCRRLWVLCYCMRGSGCRHGCHRRKSQNTHRSIRTSARSAQHSCDSTSTSSSRDTSWVGRASSLLRDHIVLCFR